MFTHHTREPHGIRKWWHFGGDRSRRCISVEFYWWPPRFGVSCGPDDDGWNFSLKCLLFSLYLGLEGFPLWRPTRTCIATWDNNREFQLVDRREFDFSIYDWTIRLTPWGQWGEWASQDPWWVRGISLDLKRAVLGRTHYHKRELQSREIQIPMPEGNYPAIATLTENTWKRRRWFADTRLFVDVSIPRGIPFAGKGENSWDCDDDGLFGYSSEGPSFEKAIAKGVESVLESRRKYGQPSTASITDALQA